MKPRLRKVAKAPMLKEIKIRKGKKVDYVTTPSVIETERDKMIWDAVCYGFMRNDLGDGLRIELRSEAYNEAKLWELQNPHCNDEELQKETRRICWRIRDKHRPDRQKTAPFEQVNDDGTSVQVGDSVALKGNRHPDTLKVDASGIDAMVFNLDFPRLQEWANLHVEASIEFWFMLMQEFLSIEQGQFYMQYQLGLVPKDGKNRTQFAKLNKRLLQASEDWQLMPLEAQYQMWVRWATNRAISKYFLPHDPVQDVDVSPLLWPGGKPDNTPLVPEGLPPGVKPQEQES